MTGLDFLIIVAGIQTGFLVALVVLIVLTRWFWMRRRLRLAGPRAELEQAVEGWVAGRSPVTKVLAQLRRLPRGVALDTLLDYSARLPPPVAARLATAVASQRWARSIRAGAGSRHWWHRLEAGRLLTVAGRQPDTSTLRRLLADPHPAVVISAIGALGRVKSPALIEAVVRRLADLAPTVQAYAAAALERTRGAVGPVLGRYLAQPGRAGLAAYVDLAGRIAIPDLRDAITQLAAHGDMEVRAAVARALRHYPHAETVATLTSLADDRAWQVRAQAVQSLARLAAPAVPLFKRALRDASWWVRLRGALALSGAGSEGLNALLAAEVGPDAFARDMARLVLGLPPAALAEYRQ